MANTVGVFRKVDNFVSLLLNYGGLAIVVLSAISLTRILFTDFMANNGHSPVQLHCAIAFLYILLGWLMHLAGVRSEPLKTDHKRSRIAVFFIYLFKLVGGAGMLAIAAWYILETVTIIFVYLPEGAGIMLFSAISFIPMMLIAMASHWFGRQIQA